MNYSTITRDNVKKLVCQFYGRVREDDLLGPVFLKALGDDWSSHLDRLSEFWSTIMLGTRSFHGNVYATHMRLNGIEPAHFRRWLDLFEQTANALFKQELADQFIVMARRVASSLQLGFFGEVIHAK